MSDLDALRKAYAASYHRENGETTIDANANINAARELITAQAERIAELEAERDAQAKSLRTADALLGSCWSLLQYVLGGHFPRPEIEQAAAQLERWNSGRMEMESKHE